MSIFQRTFRPRHCGQTEHASQTRASRPSYAHGDSSHSCREMPRFPQHNRGSYQQRRPASRGRNVYDTSAKITERNPLTQSQIADKLGVKSPASNYDADISRQNGKTVVSLVSSSSSFRVGYTTHDKAFSTGGSYSNAQNTIAADMPGRYSMKVEKLDNGMFRYTLTMDENLSGAVLDLGSEKYVVPALDKNATPATQTHSQPQQKTETYEDYLKKVPLEERSPSDKVPDGLTLGQWLGVEKIPKEILNRPYKSANSESNDPFR